MVDDHRLYSYRRSEEHAEIFTHYTHYTSSSHHSPSFSSSLLDAIYRSIDRPGEEDMMIYEQPIIGKKTGEEMANLRRAAMIEKWIAEKNVTEKAAVADVKKSRKDRHWSSSSSSDSSSVGGGSGGGGIFSFSDAEPFPERRPKPVRTGPAALGETNRRSRRDETGTKAAEHGDGDGGGGGGFSKTKSRALRMYADLKKAKHQPASPGGKLAGFLNSLFAGAAGNSRKPKISGDYSPSLKSSTTCSSASSFSRSCLSKTPPSSSKSPAGAASAKRSVRFFPVSVIVDEDCQPCGHKYLHQDRTQSAIDEELMRHTMEKPGRAAAGDNFPMNLEKKIEEFENPIINHNQEFEEDDDYDGASCASSDLFELDNLERYREELPVYETTHLDTNRAIANGLIL